MALAPAAVVHGRGRCTRGRGARFLLGGAVGAVGTTVAGDISIQIGTNTAVNVTLGAADSIDTVITKLNANATLKGQGFSAAKNAAGTSLVLTSESNRTITVGGGATR